MSAALASRISNNFGRTCYIMVSQCFSPSINQSFSSSRIMTHKSMHSFEQNSRNIFDTVSVKKNLHDYATILQLNAKGNVTNRYMCSQTVLQCWSCGKKLNTEAERFFCKCGVVQKPSAHYNLFDIMGLPTSFNVDLGFLSKRLKDLQKILHPDKFSSKGEVQIKYAQEHSALVNKAYSTLNNPLDRAIYMLELCGEIFDEGDSSDLDPEFLMDILEINEELAAATSPQEVERIGEKNKIVYQELISQVSDAFRSKDISSAKKIVGQLKYYANINLKVKEMEQDFIV